MAALAHHRRAAELLRDLDRVPDEPRIINDLRARILLEERLRQKAHHIIALNEACLLIEQEAAVKIAIPGHAEIRMALAHRLGRSLAVLLQDWVRHPVRELPVRLIVYLDQFARQILLQRVHDWPRRAVARIGHHRERLQGLHIDIGQKVLHIRIRDVHMLHAARHDIPERLERLRQHRLLELLEPRVAADWPRAGTHELHAVVLLWIVARRDHDAAIQLQMRRREIDHLRAALPDVHDIAARLREPAHQSLLQRRPRQTDIMTDRHPVRRKQLHKRPADPIRQLLIDLLRIDPAKIIGSKCFPAQFHNRTPILEL